jgi:hypothetical protein
MKNRKFDDYIFCNKIEYGNPIVISEPKKTTPKTQYATEHFDSSYWRRWFDRNRYQYRKWRWRSLISSIGTLYPLMD